MNPTFPASNRNVANRLPSLSSSRCTDIMLCGKNHNYIHADGQVYPVLHSLDPLTFQDERSIRLRICILVRIESEGGPFSSLSADGISGCHTHLRNLPRYSPKNHETVITWYTPAAYEPASLRAVCSSSCSVTKHRCSNFVSCAKLQWQPPDVNELLGLSDGIGFARWKWSVLVKGVIWDD